jgi:hypothetical protein
MRAAFAAQGNLEPLRTSAGIRRGCLVLFPANVVPVAFSLVPVFRGRFYPYAFLGQEHAYLTRIQAKINGKYL